jgi:Methyltransferase domain
MNPHELNNVRPYFRELESKEREDCVNGLPKVRLAEKHMRNCELLLNRAKLLAKLPRWAITAELGVDHGDFSEEILKLSQPQTLHLVDLWNTDRYHDGLFEGTKAKFAEAISAGRVRIHRQNSLEAAANFDDGYFDWIYIDTDHSYETTIQELRRYASKLKPEGIIAGHDYTMGNWVSGYRYGVIEALHEFCVEQNWEFKYLTIDPFESQSFAIRRIL